VSVYEAAEIMGVTVDAIRKRISRDTIPHEKDEDGRVWVILDTDQDAASKVRDADHPQSDSASLTSELRDRLRYVEQQLEAERQAHAEARRIIAGLVERIPAIEAPSEARESPETPSEPRPSTSGRPEAQTPAERVPWWRRVFGS
jgi:hypothetical protein